MDFKGKVVLITGASSGIGADTAVYLASLGASLSLSGRNEDRLKGVAEKCKNAGAPGEPLTVTGDLSKESHVDHLIKKTIENYGRLDVLVNNAAILDGQNLESLSLDMYDKVLTTNLRSIVHLTKLALPHLIKSKGNVVNISSVAGMRASNSALAYHISKSGLDQFTKCVALELGPKQVRVNSINPGAIMTDMALKFLTVDGEISKTILEHMERVHALGRLGEPREVATAIAFLASDLASNITGVLLPVDGGYAITPPL